VHEGAVEIEENGADHLTVSARAPDAVTARAASRCPARRARTSRNQNERFHDARLRPSKRGYGECEFLMADIRVQSTDDVRPGGIVTEHTLVPQDARNGILVAEDAQQCVPHRGRALPKQASASRT